MEKIERVAVVGLGYIGLPTCAILANHGISVIGIDLQQKIVDTVNRGEIHIVEKDLADMVRQAVEEGRLTAAVKPEPAQVFVIAVPTPFKDGHRPDMRYIEAAVISIAPVLVKGNLVILESTSPVGSSERISAWLAKERPDLTFPHTAGENADVRVAYCPERVMPGRIIEELTRNDRVIGGLTPKCSAYALAFYKIFVKGQCALTTARTAEMVKLTENAFRDINIAFANELSLICDRMKIDVWELISLANRHPRVNVLKPGPGVGGHCIAVDPWFIVDSAPEQAKLIAAARRINDARPEYLAIDIEKKAKRLKQPVICCLGLSYKANVDDLRGSPARNIVKSLAMSKVGKLLLVEPHIKTLPTDLAAYGVELCELNDALFRANVVALLVDHKAFSEINRDKLEGKVIIDTRGVWR